VQAIGLGMELSVILAGISFTSPYALHQEPHTPSPKPYTSNSTYYTSLKAEPSIRPSRLTTREIMIPQTVCLCRRVAPDDWAVGRQKTCGRVYTNPNHSKIPDSSTPTIIWANSRRSLFFGWSLDGWIWGSAWDCVDPISKIWRH